MDKKPSPSFLLGVEDFKRGLKTNPYSVGRWRRQWAAGYEQAQAKALPPPPTEKERHV